MFNVCPGCGCYSDEKTIESFANVGSSPDKALAICNDCGHRHSFFRLPLLIVTGASCTGKTTVALQLAANLRNSVCLESDILWRDEFAKATDDYRSYRNLWLRVAKNISQAGRPVVLFGSATPGQFEVCPESRYFRSISYLAFVCTEDELVRRLQARPSWRKSGTDEVIQRMVNFNQWLTDNATKTHPPITLLDTTSMSLNESCDATERWISEHLS